MHDQQDSRYRIESAPSGPGVRIQRIDARKRIERNGHALVVQTTDPNGRVPAVIRELFPQWFYDLRRKQNTIYGSLLRFIDVSILANVPKWMLKLIPGWISEYIDDQYPDEAKATLRKVA